MSARDGGPAFPVLTERTDFLSMGKELVQAAPGMSLRDWFAGQAIKHMRYHGMHCDDPEIGRAAVQAYKLADAMLAAREVKT